MESAPPASSSKMSPLMAAGLAVSMALTFWMMFAYVGPFQWIAELQLAWFGAYSEKITFLLTFMLVMGVLALVALPVRGLIAGNAPAATGVGDPGWYSGWILLLALGVAFLVIGGLQHFKAQNAGTLSYLEVGQLERGEKPPTMFVSISGVAVGDAGMAFGRDSSKKRYIPVIASPESRRVRLFLEMDDSAAPSGPLPGQFQGMLTRAGLPGPVRVAFQRDEMIDGDDYYVLETKQTPEKKKSAAIIMLWFGVAAGTIGLAGALIRWLRRQPGPELTA